MSNKYKFTLTRRNEDEQYGVSYNWKLVNTHTNGVWQGKLVIDVDQDGEVIKVTYFPLPCTNKGAVPTKGLTQIEHFVRKKIINNLTNYLKEIKYKNI